MAKKRKVIKRVYEKGKETTVSSLRRGDSKRIPQARPSAPSAASGNTRIGSAVVLEEKGDLPSRYGNDRLSLMVKDSFWIYAYWEISDDSLSRLQKDIENSGQGKRLILRMYDVTLKDFDGHNANHYFDIDIQGLTGDWYINLWSDSVSYIGEIGLRAAGGEFYPLIRSNWVHTPRLHYSDRREQVWMKIDENEGVSGLQDAALPFVENKKYEVNVEDRSFSVKRPPKNKKNRFSHISEEEVRRYYERLNPFIWDRISSAIASKYAESQRVPTGRSFLFTGELSEEELSNVFSLFPRSFWHRLFLGSSASLGEGGSEQLYKSPLAQSEASQGLASVSPAQRKFFFELDAEVILYGRTEPDATLELNGKGVNLRPDGTFSLRFALPDGHNPFEFKAESGDKLEKKEIGTYIRRTTDYKNR